MIDNKTKQMRLQMIQALKNHVNSDAPFVRQLNLENVIRLCLRKDVYDFNIASRSLHLITGHNVNNFCNIFLGDCFDRTNFGGAVELISHFVYNLFEYTATTTFIFELLYIHTSTNKNNPNKLTGTQRAFLMYSYCRIVEMEPEANLANFIVVIIHWIKSGVFEEDTTEQDLASWCKNTVLLV